MAKKSPLPGVGGKLFPLSKKDLDKSKAWNNYANPLSSKVLDMRAGPTGTSSVGRDREKKLANTAAMAALLQQKAAEQAAFEAKYPGGVGAPRPFPGGSGGVPPWLPPQGYNPGLKLRRQDAFGQALVPVTGGK